MEIHVDPIAWVELPQGSGFELYIPRRAEGRGQGGPFKWGRAPHLDIAEIPFEVRSNSRVTVEALPGVIRGYFRGAVIGSAFPAPEEQANIAAGAVLPYRVIVEFPAKPRRRAVPGFSKTRGANASVSHSETADASGEPLSGVVYLVPDITWGDVASGRFKMPGLYKGVIQITVSAGDR